MKKHYIFIDESGSSDPKMFKFSPVFTVCGLVIGQNTRSKILNDLGNLKQKYFKKKDYILHSIELKRHLKDEKNIINFAKDLNEILNKNSFFILTVTTDSKKAFRMGWDKSKIINNSYRILIGNLIKFLIAKNLCGQIFNEASSVEQDIILYKNFFHYQANGLNRLNISPKDVKKHLTSLSFVTKLNNDPEQQLVDLYGICPKINFLLKKKIIPESGVGAIEKVLLKSLDKKLF